MSWATVVVGGASIIAGAVQTNKAKKIAEANKRPELKTQQPVLDNQAIAESRAGTGLSDAAKQVFATGAERGLSSSVSAVLRGGGSVNNIAELFDTYQGGISKMALVDEEMRAKNIQQLIAQNDSMGNEMDKQFQVNEYGPYADNAQAAMVLRKQGTDNIMGGVNSIGSRIVQDKMAKMYKDDTKKVFGNKAPGAGQPTITPVLRDGVWYDGYTGKKLSA